MRHAVAILALPFVAVAVIPAAVVFATRDQDTRWNLDWPALAALWAVALALWVAGFALWVWCVWLLARVGRGTLAPWDQTRHLVAVGPYRHVRNPMIAGTLAMLFGEGLCLGSAFVTAWAAGFWAMNHAYFLASEEPGLARRFGEAYRQYRAAVPRWIPRRGPWAGPGGVA